MMTREEAYTKALSIDRGQIINKVIDMVYDDFEIEIKKIKNRSCESCKHFTTYKGEYGTCKLGVNNRKIEYLHNSFYCNIWQEK